jgi:16S rRNA (guanine(966)-N(2))-methyltransferase RsmD
MRVIAGRLKGRRLKAPTWEGLRPTSDKLRETLFNILAPRIAGARVIDAFAGTGALGIEALSRGAAEVTFIERDRRAQALIADNLAHCGVESGCAIIRASVARSFEQLCQAPRFVPFDIVLLDPPYDTAPHDVVDVVASAGRLLASDGVVVLEHAYRRPSPERAGSLVRVRQVRSSDSELTFYQPQQA